MTAKNLYDRDFLQWTQCNAALLRAGRFAEADIEHVAEEIEDMGKSQHNELRNRLRVLLIHLLKCGHAGRPSSSWIRTINTQRASIDTLLETAPSLRPTLSDNLDKAYRRAAHDTAREMRLTENPFPESCPFSLREVLDEEFIPNVDATR